VKSIVRKISGTCALFLFLAVPQLKAAGSAKSYAFVNSQFIITAEVATEHTFVLNFINLSDFVIVNQPGEFIYKGSSGRIYIGQVYEFEHKDGRGDTQKYSASILLRGHSFTGLTIVGSFHEQDQIEELSVRVGAKRYYLKPQEKSYFEQLAKKIENFDLDSSNPATALQEANISELGSVKSTDGTSEWDRDWQGLLTPDGVNPPKAIERPEIPFTDDAKKSRISGKIKLSALINKNGGIQDVKVVKGLDRKLDARVVEAVTNSWLFLPATKNGEVLDAAIVFDVEFPASGKRTE
jgi:TonB family protein